MKKDVLIKLNSKDFEDRVYACWVGKNIGGTMGAPYEGTREILDIKGYKTEPNVVLPNDDLDLQLIWLHTLEKLGANKVNAQTLGEAWLSFIVPHWNEYGIAKANMERGLVPPLAGDYNNSWKDSNGAWIRTEVWACTAPGCPDIAAKYAVEDAKVDHGSGEGTFAAAFVAAMQATAFITRDLRECIAVGLSMIPENSRMADSVRFAMECYDKKIPAMEARNLICERNMDIGDGWFEAPSNVAYAILGLLYGEGDFKKSMITAINCGDDTDCTAATVGATLGILGGSAIIPDDWQKHIGDDIVTISINRGSIGRGIPKTCRELTDRVVAEAPHLLFANEASVAIVDGESVIPEDAINLIKAINSGERFGRNYKNEIMNLKANTVTYEFPLATVTVTLDRAPDISVGEEIGLHVEVRNNVFVYDTRQYNLNLRWWLPEGFSVDSRKTLIMKKPTRHNTAISSFDCKIVAGEQVEAENRIVLEIDPIGRCSPMYIPIILLG